MRQNACVGSRRMYGKDAYCPCTPESTVRYGIVAQNLETFLARQQARERALPAFVEEEFRSLLKCGIAEFGFLRLNCTACGKDRLLPYSCKNRDVCPTCGGRRMADTAAHLVDRVIPAVPVRQWISRRVAALLERRDGPVTSDQEEPALAAIYRASIMVMIATGPNAGQ